jgi:hypothetical protein
LPQAVGGHLTGLFGIGNFEKAIAPWPGLSHLNWFLDQLG